MPSVDAAIPTVGRAAVTRAYGIETEFATDYPVKQPSELAPGECLVKLECTGVCHTDLTFMAGLWRFQPPLPSVGGHEGVGRILAIGAHTPPGEIQLGDRVGIRYSAAACLHCEMCRRGYEQYCESEKISGYSVDGTFAEYVVAFLDHVIPIPQTVPSAAAAPILCAGVTVYSALKQLSPIAGEWLVISGAGGGLGHLAIQYAVRMGLRVLAIDTGAPKRALALALGAEHFLDFTVHADVPAAVHAVTGAPGPHAALLTTGSNAAYVQAARFLRPQGTVLCVGVPTQDLSGIPMELIIGMGIRYVGTKTGSRQDTRDALEFVARGQVRCEYEERPIEEINEVLEAMHAGTLLGRVVLKF
ncbi:chaperonin 10-like protein [Amylocystis lapponica]|nr:chaperonin 10-like protein [Amylocystis lapponica]